MPHKTLFTEEQVVFIRKHAPGRHRMETLELVNKTFGLQVKPNQMLAWMKNHKVTCGLVTRFQPGNEPPNKGVKGAGGHEPTQFKKGHRPVNYKPVGTERINADGYVDIKISDTGRYKWKAKHVIIWEEANGPVPEGHVLLFADKDKQNVTLENLILVTRSQLAILNGRGLLFEDAESTKTGIIIADLSAKASERKRNDSKSRAFG